MAIQTTYTCDAVGCKTQSLCTSTFYKCTHSTAAFVIDKTSLITDKTKLFCSESCLLKYVSSKLKEL